ncbi:hypothetical protein MINT15_18300 [Saccharomonospora viridis]|uniref:Uncharacterized protein n=1 Tax=Saccharomonospora viridis TaxID=1852 RepID=A0A837DDB4_9PSEU|nr:hypothetical protein MINT15_18300 [Saccharomonospora viridis]
MRSRLFPIGFVMRPYYPSPLTYPVGVCLTRPVSHSRRLGTSGQVVSRPRKGG